MAEQWQRNGTHQHSMYMHVCTCMWVGGEARISTDPYIHTYMCMYAYIHAYMHGEARISTEPTERLPSLTLTLTLTLTHRAPTESNPNPNPNPNPQSAYRVCIHVCIHAYMPTERLPSGARSSQAFITSVHHKRAANGHTTATSTCTSTPNPHHHPTPILTPPPSSPHPHPHPALIPTWQAHLGYMKHPELAPTYIHTCTCMHLGHMKHPELARVGAGVGLDVWEWVCLTKKDRLDWSTCAATNALELHRPLPPCMHVCTHMHAYIYALELHRPLPPCVLHELRRGTWYI